MAKVVLIALALFCLVNAESKVYNFNTEKYCSRGKTYTKTESLDANDRATVIFRQPGDNAGSFLNNLFNNIPDECSMQFRTGLLSFKDKLQVRFDSQKRNINDDMAVIRFYDADEVKASKKVLEVSKKHPISSNSSFITNGSFLTIQVYRDFKSSKNYNIEMIIEPVGSARTTMWSSVVLSFAILVRHLI